MAKGKSKGGDLAYARAEARIQRALRNRATHLDLGGMDLHDLPPSIGQLTQLRTLSLYNNRLRALPEAIGRLTELRTLRLQANQLTTWPETLVRLTQLQTLHLSGNQLTALPEVIGQLTQLQGLHLWGNYLTALPEVIGQLKGLQTLDLRRNRLTALPETIGQLTWLQTLDLSRNQLTALPEVLRRLSALKGLYLHGNDALGIPPEILGPERAKVAEQEDKPAKPSDILDYYFRLRADGRPLNEAKLILLGRGEVGKTCLVNRLVHNKFASTSMTRGITITQWPVTVGKDNMRLHVWDFGGQEIQHATHQFFLTERSLYLVVLNGRAGTEDEDAEYWLKFVKTFGAGSPTIVVLNKCRINPFEVNPPALREKYPFIRAFVETDCKPKSRNGIPELKAEIASALDAMEHVRTGFPACWFAIKDRLAAMKKPFISFREFRKICDDLGEKDTEAQERLACYLNALGIALNYRMDPRLRDETVLNPHWITEGVYQIITSDVLAKQQGELRLGDLGDILPKKTYPKRMHAFLIELMRKFELCFPYHDDPKEHRYLVPERLGKEQPPLEDAFPPQDCLSFRYDYRLMPEGLLPRFITRTHTMSRPAERWRTGVVLRWEGSRALVTADKSDRQVLVRVHGPADKRRRLLAVIRENFDHIHSEMREFKPTEWVALQGHPDEWVSHRDLEVFEQGKRVTMEKSVGDTVVPVNVSKTLDSTDVPGARDRNKPRLRERRPLKVFISYAHEDEKWRATLAPNLDLLQREGLVDVWCDLRIRPGEMWDDEIKRKLEEADIYLFLMSTDLLASKYVQETEWPIARRRHAENEARLVPIVVRKCSWMKYVGDIQALPKGGEPVKKWRDKDEACFGIEEGLRRIIDDIHQTE